MKAIRTMLAALLMAAVACGAFAAKKAAKDVECEASKAPEATSTQERAGVKAEAKVAAKSVECGDIKTQPKAASAKQRAEVKSEAVSARKAGTIPKGEAGTTAK